VNRVRAQPQASHVVATWAETGHVQVWDVKPQLMALNGETGAGAAAAKLARLPPRQVFTGHRTEGFALDWSPVAAGRLLSGDCAGAVHLWEPAEGGRWAVGPETFAGHGGSSVEDLQWSPNEAGVFASCAVDGAVCIWDVRQRARPALRTLAHDTDANVLSWNRLSPAMLASAADDGSFRIWDLRHFAAGGFVAHFKYHTAAVTSIEWAPFDSSVLATSSADHQTAIWDLAVERDAEEEAAAMAQAGNALPPAELPPQLMFVHQGQRDVKELHWHPQVPGLLVSTAATGFNVWKPENVAQAQAVADAADA
jgi:ribosome assembly protein RRB1